MAHFDGLTRSSQQGRSNIPTPFDESDADADAMLVVRYWSGTRALGWPVP
jgi:hypothetical protein